MAMSPEQRAAALERLKPTQFKPGQSGNPGGVPKPRALTLESALRERIRKDPHVMNQIVDALVREVKKGSPAHLKILAERVGGVVGLNVYDREEQGTAAASASKTIIFTDEGDDEDEDEGPDALPGQQ